MPTTRKKSGDPRKTVSSASKWKKKNEDTTLEVPSGEVCRLKRPGLPQLLAENVLPDLLTPIAMEAIQAGQSGQQVSLEDTNKQFSDLMSKPGGLEQMLDATDRITAHCVLEPKVLYHRRVKAAGQIDQIQQSYIPEWETIPDDERDEDALYTDQIDMEDKMFIMNFVVGGSRDLERFRQELGQSMASLESGAGLPNDAS